MKILWIVNTIFPYPAKKLGIEKEVFGGWLNGLADNLIKSDKIELAIATVYKGKEIKKYNDGTIKYYLLPNKNNTKYNKVLELYWKKINNEFNPDIVHIHGTEYPHSLAFINACPNVKIVTSIQGLMHRIGEVYFANISNSDINKNMTFRDIIRHDNLFRQKKKFDKRGKLEKEIISNSNYIIGRTDWDYYNTNAINNKAKYYCLNETVRDIFYNKQWNINKIERNSIYISQGSYPIKGLHILIEAINIVKKDFPNVRLYVSGINILKDDSIKDKIKLTGYGNYIKSLIKKYKLQDDIIFTGVLNEEQIVQRLLKTHIVIVPSIIENESNSLTEAHLLGIPTIAAFSGGMTNRIVHKKTGFLYPFSEPAMCAGYIMEYFRNDELAIKYGKAAKQEALIRNNPEKNQERIIEIYKDIMGDNL